MTPGWSARPVFVELVHHFPAVFRGRTHGATLGDLGPKRGTAVLRRLIAAIRHPVIAQNRSDARPVIGEHATSAQSLNFAVLRLIPPARDSRLAHQNERVNSFPGSVKLSNRS